MEWPTAFTRPTSTACGDRSRRRHGRLPQRPASVPRQECRHLHVVQQRRQGRRRRAAAQRDFRAIRRPLFPRAGERRGEARSDQRQGGCREAGRDSDSTTRGSRSNFLAVVDLIGQTKVGGRRGRQSGGRRRRALNGQPRKWVHVGPMLWRDANGHEMLGANVADGKATRFSFGELAPIIDFDRTPGYRSSAWLLPLLYFSLGVLLLTDPAVADAGDRPAPLQVGAAARGPQLGPIAAAGSRRSRSSPS